MVYIPIFFSEIYTICLFVFQLSPFRVPLARWPGHLALAEYVDMQVLYRLLSVFARIDDAAVSVLKSFLSAHFFDLQHHVSHELRVLIREIIQ